ncbi:hypothetical protein MRX96_058538 [Rhipicephalus microplus]
MTQDMEQLTDRDSLPPVLKVNSSCPLQVKETFAKFRHSIEAQLRLKKWMVQGQHRPVESAVRSPMKRKASITEGQPDAQLANISDENTKSTADVAQSLPALMSTLTCAESEPLDEEPQNQASAIALSMIRLHPVPSPPPPSSTIPARRNQQQKTQANKTALGVSVQPLQLPQCSPSQLLE